MTAVQQGRAVLDHVLPSLDSSVGVPVGLRFARLAWPDHTRMRHSQWQQKPLAQEVKIWLARNHLDDSAKQIVVGVAVGIARAWFEIEGHVLESGNHVVAVRRREEAGELTGAAQPVGNSRRMRQQVAKRDEIAARIIGDVF